MSHPRPARWLIALALVGFLLSVTHASAARAAQATATFEPPTASFEFGTSITFSDVVSLTAVPRRAELLLTEPGSTGPTAIEVATPVVGRQTLTNVIKIADGHVYPNTTFEARWRITDADGTQELGPSTSLTYADTRFAWKTKTGSIVRVHWYNGDDAFGARALAIGEKGIANASALLGVTETAPVDFFIYDSTAPFYDALGPGTRENVGGEANSEIRTLFALITPDEINAAWVGTVIPHELTHLVFNTATANPYHGPPRWLNEGLAVYESEGYTPSWRSTVEGAVSSGAIIPLDGLTGQFPTTADQFALAYGESVSAVDFMIRTYGQQALVSLVRSYARGVSDDEAFKAALGLDTSGFNGAWLKDLGVTAPQAYGPQSPPPGPLPSAWLAANPQSSASPASGGPAAAAPTPAGPNPSKAPGSASSTQAGDASAVVVGLLVAGAIVAVVGLIYWRSRRASPPGPPSPPGPASPPAPPGQPW
jgi:Peptidase MA superfamily